MTGTLDTVADDTLAYFDHKVDQLTGELVTEREVLAESHDPDAADALTDLGIRLRHYEGTFARIAQATEHLAAVAHRERS